MNKLVIHFPAGTLAIHEYDDLVVSWRYLAADATPSIDPPNDPYQRYRGESPLAELLTRFSDAALILILSAADVRLTQVSLSRQQARHLSRVLPYLLEGELLDDVETLQFVSGKATAGQYPVALFNREAMATLITYLAEQKVTLLQVLVDASLLTPAAPLLCPIGEQVLLIDPEHQALVTDASSADLLMSQYPDHEFHHLESDDVWQQMLAALPRPQLDLMQSGWRSNDKHRGSGSGLWQRWKLASVAAAAIVALVWITMGVQYVIYRTSTDAIEQQSARLYQSMFPNDRATAKVRAQFKGHLAKLQAGSGQGAEFMTLIEKAGPALAAQRLVGTRITRIQYDQRNQRMLLDVDAPSYPLLQQLREQLSSAALSAEISVAKTQGERVNARLNVEQG